MSFSHHLNTKLSRRDWLSNYFLWNRSRACKNFRWSEKKSQSDWWVSPFVWAYNRNDEAWYAYRLFGLIRYFRRESGQFNQPRTVRYVQTSYLYSLCWKVVKKITIDMHICMKNPDLSPWPLTCPPVVMGGRWGLNFSCTKIQPLTIILVCRTPF